MTLDQYLDKTGEKLIDFADRSGVSQSYLSRLLAGDRFPSPRIIEKLARATGGRVTATDLYEAYRSPKKKPSRKQRAKVAA